MDSRGGSDHRRHQLVTKDDHHTTCSHLAESRDCSVNACFQWKIVKKEDCFLISKSGSCGQGTRKLLHACTDHQGVSTSPILHWITVQPDSAHVNPIVVFCLKMGDFRKKLSKINRLWGTFYLRNIFNSTKVAFKTKQVEVHFIWGTYSIKQKLLYHFCFGLIQILHCKWGAAKFPEKSIEILE